MTDRRTLLKTALLGGVATGTATEAIAAATERGAPVADQWVSIIDLDRCDGCLGQEMPACVRACRKKNAEKFPEPVKPLQPYWPQKKFEDFSEQRERTDRLTPYNWLYVEKIRVGEKTVYAPRRCMHCFDAPCRKICPFGAIDKSAQGAVGINPNVCFGGAKCRDVCPWEIPQRQAGVGLYLDVAPKFAGGGVMYKCDFCADLLQKGETPACASACPKGAMVFLPIKVARERIGAMAAGRFVYGQTENGGTATWYVSSVDFKTLLAAEGGAPKAGTMEGKPAFVEANPKLAEDSAWVKVALAAPVAAVAAAYVLRKRKALSGQEDQKSHKEA